MAAFVDYCHENNLATISIETFSKKVVEYFGSSVYTERATLGAVRKIVWRGIKLIESEDKEVQETL